jgi:hypothetical protein
MRLSGFENIKFKSHNVTQHETTPSRQFMSFVVPLMIDVVETQVVSNIFISSLNINHFQKAKYETPTIK